MAINNAKNNSGKNVLKKNRQYKQARLNLATKLKKCLQCGMTYSSNIIDDSAIHTKYHAMQLHGRKWSTKWGSPVTSFKIEPQHNITPPTSSPIPDAMITTDRSKGKIYMIQPENKSEVKAMFEIMEIVNKELNAPTDENQFWSQPDNGGKAFVYVKNDRAVGAITVEVLQSERCRWMVYDSRKIIEHVRPNFLLGISRIWVCKTERLNGIATKLLEAARTNTVYGKVAEKWEIAWSQPTESGGKLASKYNGVMHKSNKLLIPCYI